MTMTNLEVVVRDRTWLRSTAHSTAAAEARSFIVQHALSFLLYIFYDINQAWGGAMVGDHPCVSRFFCRLHRFR